MKNGSEDILAAFDEQIRRGSEPGVLAEADAHVVRTISPGWSGVTWSDLDATNADSVIAAEVRHFAGLGRAWEWKYYSYDRPDDLPDRLSAAGFDRAADEALMVARIADLDLDCPLPAGVELRHVNDESGIQALTSLHNVIFGGDHSSVAESLRQDNATAVMAMAGHTPVSAGRLEFRPGTEFAGLWGGGTIPEWRGRGIFRALVAHRAALAADSGVRYLQVDATDQSRPILQRLGFAQLATTTPFIHP